MVKAFLARPRDVRLSIDIRLQVRAASLVRNALEQGGYRRGAAVVMAEDGDVLSAVSYPWPSTPPSGLASPAGDQAPAGNDEQLLDRARYGVYPPGSSFKLVTATAALRKDPALLNQTFACVPLGDGRVGRDPGLVAAGAGRRGGSQRARRAGAGAGARRVVQRLLRAARPPARGAGSPGDRRPVRDPAGPAGEPAPGARDAAVCRLRAGPGAGVALQDGARGGDDRGGRQDAAGPLGAGRDEPRAPTPRGRSCPRSTPACSRGRCEAS